MIEMNSNPATVWAETVVAELVAGGLEAVCVAPGSRSTALALAFAAHPGVRVYSHLDERSAGFFALGMALFWDKPVALLSTSGTATANFMPAIIEARMSQVPLLVLTADRPPELRHSGANQTIDQVKMYGDQVLWSVDVALPEAAAGAVLLRSLRTMAARALAVANGVVKGPVHLNFPFRKPFEPVQGDRALAADVASGPFTQMAQGRVLATDEQVEPLVELLEAEERGLIVCGPRCPAGDFPQAVAALSRRTGYPILADALSGVRFGPWVGETAVCGGYETYLRGSGPGWAAPRVILRFGAVPTSKWLNVYLEQQAPAQQVHVRSNGAWSDDAHVVNWFLQADEAPLCRELVTRLPQRGATAWTAQVQQTEEEFWQALPGALDEGFFDGAAVADVMAQLADGALLFAGNSLPVRHVEQYARPLAKRVRVFANRGASGIDGNVSTALGIAAASGQRVVALLGDVTFYHDMNGLLAAGRHGLPLTVVLLNNDGGGIFRRLPVSQFEPPFEELFLTRHGLDFRLAAQMYGLRHVRVTEREAFVGALQDALDGERWVVELVTDGERDFERQTEVVRRSLP
jgi:2-succinyl-5-enolpyruvyl-6-hydroxy-3-cyclohexene-1-carboxylate synthase